MKERGPKSTQQGSPVLEQANNSKSSHMRDGWCA